MDNNTRSKIKHNFLKRVLFRLDFNGLLDSDIDKVIEESRQLIYNNGFVVTSERVENQIDFQFKIENQLPEENLENLFSIGNKKISPVKTFESDDHNKKLEISKTFLTLDINAEKGYKTFSEYINLIVLLIDSLKKQSPFFKTLRIGLRKINLCIINSIELLSNYFCKGAFNISDTMSCLKEFDCKASNSHTILQRDLFSINYIRNIQEGIFHNSETSKSTVFQVVLDIDVYCNNLNILPELLKDNAGISKTLETQNDYSFECFFKSLTTDFYNKLCVGNFTDEHIMGVI